MRFSIVEQLFDIILPVTNIFFVICC